MHEIFVYIDSLTTIGYLTQVVLLPGTLAAAVFRSDRFRLSEYTGLVFVLVISGLPWAAVGALLASGRKRWATMVATVAVLASAIPGILFWLIAKGLGEGAP
jgi:ABC-type anion transport system duplicated permease subunit